MDPCTMIAAGAGAVAAVAAAPAVVAAAGFTATGIAAGSLAASMMSSAALASGGGVVAGSVVATLQSVGAAGIPLGASAAIGAIGATVGAVVGGPLICSSGETAVNRSRKREETSLVWCCLWCLHTSFPRTPSRSKWADFICSTGSSTQLCTPKEKIRMALKDWQDVMQFQQDAVNALHYDVVYILRKLLSEKSFYFTAMPTVGRSFLVTSLCSNYLLETPHPRKNKKDFDIQGDDVLKVLANTIMAIYVIRKEGGDLGHYEDIGIVVDGVIILEHMRSIAQACAVMLGAIYALNLAYPKELKYYYEFIQKVLMQMVSERLSSKVQGLKNKISVRL
ncbi:uncharacterized protein LOC127414073 isoform X1 [Myxocyprinus asiaticus]|uniref:uncharacterized protein LOC127414073 isoform X1 n=1 Tax=Myxocyprinus asiaticus TaxID=70543 RepID=UPI00222159EA|nr:uncharacterized protein LOC127414073 isoform X1 [Myxocyprinus asiaticus]